MGESKYGKYIVTELKPKLKLPEFRREMVPASDTDTTVLWLDEEVIKGAFYVECTWYWKKFDVTDVEAHTHDFDEVIGFFGSNPKDVYDLGGEIEIWLGDEKHVLRNSCLIFVPRGLKHCPLKINRVDRPFFHFTAGTRGTYR
jgi:hypothetical protein